MLVAKAQQWASWWDDWEQNSFRRNPYDALKPGLEPWIREQARAVLQETVAQQRDQQAVQSFQQRHADWLYHKGPDGRPLANPQQPGQFVLSPVGQRFAQHLGQAEGLGIRNAADQLRYAEAMFESELARRAAQAPAVPPPQTGPQALAALAQQNPLAAAQQAVFSPGLFAPQQQNQAPGMTYSQPQGLSFDALAAAGTQPAMPPGAGYLPGGTPYAGQHPGTVQAQGFSAPSPFGLTMGQLLERNAVAAGLMQPTPGTQPGSLW